MEAVITERHKQIFTGQICPYCSNPSVYVDSKIVYGKSYGMIYLCEPCEAYVGVHKGTNKALGRLANNKLRDAKIEAHKYFDLIWKLKIKRRKAAYTWLSNQIGTPREYTHIGMFNVETCYKVVDVCKQLLKEYNRAN